MVLGRRRRRRGRRARCELLAERPEGVTVSVVREALGSSRKYVLPLLAHLDATGMTRTARRRAHCGGPARLLRCVSNEPR